MEKSAPGGVREYLEVRKMGSGQTNREDTIRLLQECDAGIKMGVEAIGDVLDHVESRELKKMLQECRSRHQRLAKDVEEALQRSGAEGKKPGFAAQVMSRMKTSVKLSAEDTDRTVAGLMTDGANMGVKSLHRYLNAYRNAEKDVREIAQRLASLEERLARELQPFL